MGLDSGSVDRMRKVLRHRLLNIMAGVKSANSLLASDLDDRLAPREREYFSLIQKECDQVSIIMNRLEELLGDLPAPAPAPLESVLSSLMTDLRATYPMAEVLLDISVADPARSVCGSMLKTAIFEAVGNAYEISRKPVTISICDAEEKCSVRIIDKGAPLSDEVCELAFEPFYTMRTRHVGVGLSIARRMAENLGGSASIATSPDGNSVEFVLPYM